MTTTQTSLFADDRAAAARREFVAAYRDLEVLHGKTRAALSITACAVADGGTVNVIVFVGPTLRTSGPQESATEAARAVFAAHHGDLR